MSLDSSTTSIAAPRFDEIDGASRVRRALQSRIRDVLDRTNGHEQILQVSVPVPTDVSPLAWLRAQRGADATADAVYWNGRDDARAAAGIGRADVLSSRSAPVDYTRLDRRLAARLATAKAPVRYFGGLRFDASQRPASGLPSDVWASFGTFRFVLPRFTLTTHADNGAPRLTCTLCLPRDRVRAELIVDGVDDVVLPAATSPDAPPSPVDRVDSPGRETWAHMVRWALDAFDDGDVQKVVFARRVLLAFERTLDPYLLLRHLQTGTPGCFHFAVRPDDGPVFVGASPERLFRMHHGVVDSEAVAGTRSRGDSEQADAELDAELLDSEKDRREHAFVEDAIRDRLGAVCSTVRRADEASTMTLARGRHLYSALSGRLLDGITAVDLLDLLHPTPAVGGVPTGDALDAIRAQEPFDRGWYAGPVGWIGPDAAEFAVAIRSGLVQGRELALYSGAGLVDGSVPSKEWDEIEQKIGDFAAVLGIV